MQLADNIGKIAASKRHSAATVPENWQHFPETS